MKRAMERVSSERGNSKIIGRNGCVHRRQIASGLERKDRMTAWEARMRSYRFQRGARWALNAVEALEGCKQDLSYILKGDSGCCVEMNCPGIGECWKTN